MLLLESIILIIFNCFLQQQTPRIVGIVKVVKVQDLFCKIIDSYSFSSYPRHLSPNDFAVFNEGNLSLNFPSWKCNRTDQLLVFNFENKHYVLNVKQYNANYWKFLFE